MFLGNLTIPQVKVPQIEVSQQAGGIKFVPVRLAVRIRSLNSKLKQGNKKCINKVNEQPQVNLVNKDKTYSYDFVFDENKIQKEVYRVSAAYLVKEVLKCFNGTIFVHGQVSLTSHFI